MAHPDPLERRRARSRRPVAVAARVDLREHHVLERGSVAEQVEGLEHEADAARAQGGALLVAEAAGVDAVDAVGARRRPVEAAEDVQERGLARARRPDDRQPVAAVDGQVDAAQGLHGRIGAERAAAARAARRPGGCRSRRRGDASSGRRTGLGSGSVPVLGSGSAATARPVGRRARPGLSPEPRRPARGAAASCRCCPSAPLVLPLAVRAARRRPCRSSRPCAPAAALWPARAGRAPPRAVALADDHEVTGVKRARSPDGPRRGPGPRARARRSRTRCARRRAAPARGSCRRRRPTAR